MRARHVFLLMAVVAPVCGFSEAPASRPAALPATRPVEQREPSVTSGQVKIGAGLLTYKASAGMLPLKDDAGKVKANIFHVAYERTDRPERSAPRPIMFLFNGGPGAASVWLHLGAVGPKRIDTRPDGRLGKPPVQLVDNEHTWLSEADLVFVDPVSTGFSRAATPEAAKEFHGYREDIQAMGEFVRLYLTRNNRWDSPKYLAGESYGTTRAAGLADHLQERQGIAINGVILVSTVLNFAVLSPRDGNDLPYPLFLPTYTAAAWQQQRLPADLQADLGKTLKEVEAFALGEYTSALAQGDQLAEGTRAALVDKLARYTGLDKAYIARVNLRIDPGRFRKELLRAQGKVMGRFDARLTGDPLDAGNDAAEYDPSLTEFLAAYTETFNGYVRRTLKFETDAAYEVLTPKVFPWKFGEGHGMSGGYLYVGDSLRSAMTRNPHLKLFVAQGWFDLATPYFAADYQVSHLGLSKNLRANVTQKYYPGGHMMYHEHKSLEQLHRDAAGFLK